MRYRPSPSMIVAVVALIVACTGSAVAATVITSNQIKDGTIKAADLSSKAKKSLKGKTGATGPTGPAGATGPQGPAGPAGAAGPAGTARAYARVIATSGGVTLDPTFTKNFTAVTRTGTGVYCLTTDPAAGIDTLHTPAFTTVDFQNTDSPEGDASALFRLPSNCPDPGQVRVGTERATSAAAATESNTVSFVVLVP